MPIGLKRYHQSLQTHFITFSCFHRKPLLRSELAARTFELALESVRRSYQIYLYGYVVMPDHVHLLLSEPKRSLLSEAVKALKQSVSRRLPEENGRFWQTRYYDFNVHGERKRVEKLRYIHRNPVRAGLCAAPKDWPWSSFLHYSLGEFGVVEIESERTAKKRQELVASSRT
jgi:putative transposase